MTQIIFKIFKEITLYQFKAIPNPHLQYNLKYIELTITCFKDILQK